MSNNDPLLLAIDQGTTSSRAIAYTAAGEPVGVAQREFTQIFPADGWVEHDPEEIWQTTLAVCREVVEAAGGPARFAAIGITNQRETTVVWDRDTGKAVHNAIVWQDRRTADHCAELRERGHEQSVSEKTGLLLDPYFSATKIGWILDHVDGARERVASLAAGTIDAFLIWRLTGGAVHATDVTNASRTMLYDIDAGRWDDELLDLFRVPASLLPEVRDNTADYGKTVTEIFGGEIPVLGVAGDQQAAAIGQACIQPGMIKSTYGTGCFAILNTGQRIVRSRHRLLTTVAYRVNGSTHYALEGAIFVAGAAVQWLRDGLGIIESASQTEAMARSLPGNNGVYLVPAFTGLGAPHWDPHARGALFGLTRDTGPAELARAALEAVGYSTRELLDAMAKDGQPSSSVRVDGGMVANDWLAQFLADITGVVVERPVVTETTALGAAMLAGVQAGLFGSLQEASECWHLDKQFEPAMDDEERDRLLRGWHDAVRRTLS